MPPTQAPNLDNISDDQIKFATEMMKNNPEMMRNMLKTQGMDISEEQIKMMSQFMTPEMM